MAAGCQTGNVGNALNSQTTPARSQCPLELHFQQPAREEWSSARGPRARAQRRGRRHRGRAGRGWARGTIREVDVATREQGVVMKPRETSHHYEMVCRRQDGARCVAHRGMEVGNREAIPCCRIRSLAQAMDRRKNIRLDQSQSSLGARLRTLCHDRHGLHPPRHDPHHAKATCCKRLVMNPIFSDGFLSNEYSDCGRSQHA